MQMQLQIPIYPSGSKMISSCLAVNVVEDDVDYIANGLNVFSHEKDDHNAFRFITSNFIDRGLCKLVEVQRCFNVSESNVAGYLKKYREKGASVFFGEKEVRASRSHKILDKKKERIQEKLDKGQSVNSIAKEEGVREGAIRYQIQQGNLKKK
jgi:DNA-binding NarL/FixJ family response regulator